MSAYDDVPESGVQRGLIAARIRAIQSQAPAGTVLFVGIGGHGASGKTTLANAIAELIPSTQIVPTDQFFNGQLFELDRLLTDVVQVLNAGRPASYSSWDWQKGCPGDFRSVLPRGVVILDGVCALDQRFRDFELLRIWVDTPVEVRLVRGIARDGENSRDLWVNKWLPGERAYVERDAPIACAHLVVSGSHPF